MFSFVLLQDKKQNLIQVLVKQNINSQLRLDAQIKEVNIFFEISSDTEGIST